MHVGKVSSAMRGRANTAPIPNSATHDGGAVNSARAPPAIPTRLRATWAPFVLVRETETQGGPLAEASRGSVTQRPFCWSPRKRFVLTRLLLNYYSRPSASPPAYHNTLQSPYALSARARLARGPLGHWAIGIKGQRQLAIGPWQPD